MGTTTLIFWYLVLLVFGQLPKLIFQFLGILVPFQITDILVLLIFILNFQKSLPKNAKFLIFIFILSWIFSLLIFGIKTFNPGVLYLIRFITYIGLFYIFSGLVKNKILNRVLILKTIISVCVVIAIFGWIQLLFIPDLRSLITLGWDDHYFRLVSTFLDPSFAGVIILIGSWVSFKYYKYSKNAKYLLITIFLAITIIPTYSRATYLAAVVLIVFNFIKLKTNKYNLLIVAIFILLTVLVFPKPSGEGGNLLRTKSIELKIQNAVSSVEIFKSSPVFGVGFNNICLAKQNLNIKEGGLNACSGVDNSLLFILSTTGVAGFFVFLGFIKEIIKNTSKNYFGQIFIGVLLIIFIHGQFTNTFFYPFVLGILAILGGISRNYGE